MSDLPIHYAPAKKGLWILGVISLGLTSVGVVVAVPMGPLGWLTAGFGALLFGACTVVIFYRALASAPVLSLTQEGMKAWRYPQLRWEEIDFAETAMSSGQMFLVLHAKDHEGYLARFGFFKRKWAQLSTMLLEGSVYLSPQLFLVPVSDVARTINAELARRRGGHTRR
jgi:hypothetical protein